MSTQQLGQIKELLALTLLGALSSTSGYFLPKDVSQGLIAKHGNPMIHADYDLAHASHHPLKALAIVVDPGTWLLTLLASHRIARIILDIFGGFFVFRSGPDSGVYPIFRHGLGLAPSAPGVLGQGSRSHRLMILMARFIPWSTKANQALAA